MKKLFTILLLTIGFSLNAQYYSITYVNVPPENQAEFASIETTYWSKVAQPAIDAGKQSAWGLDAAVGGVPNGWTHAFVNVYETAEDLANASTNWDPESVLGIEASLLNTVGLTDGGFSYKSALTLSVIDNQKYKIRVTVDGMHRIIMALLCGVDKVAVVEEEEVLPNATQEEIEKIEHDLFDAANARSAKVDTSTQKCSNKKSGNMSQKDKNQDNMFADPRVRICVGTGSGAFGKLIFSLDRFFSALIFFSFFYFYRILFSFQLKLKLPP